MAKIIQVSSKFNIHVPTATAQAVQKKRENIISLEALGLLVNLLSYPSKWEVNKTELYKRFSNHGERSVKTAWNSLVAANYIIEFKYRKGRKWEYVYYFQKIPFTDKEKTDILQNAEKEYGEIAGLQNEDLILGNSKCRGNQKNLLNKNTILNTNNQYIANIHEEKRSSLENECSPFHNEENFSIIISNLREQTKGDLNSRSFDAVVRKVMDKYNQGKMQSFRDYLVTALTNKIGELEYRREKDKWREEWKVDILAKKSLRKQTPENQPLIKKELPFYNSL